MNKKIKLLIKISVSLVLFYQIYGKIDFFSLKRYLSNTDLFLISAAFFFVILNTLTAALRLYFSAKKKYNIKLAKILVAYCSSIFFTYLLPAGFGSDIKKYHFLTSASKDKNSYIFLAIDKAIGGLGIIFSIFIILFFSLFNESILTEFISQIFHENIGWLGIIFLISAVVIFAIYKKKYDYFIIAKKYYEEASGSRLLFLSVCSRIFVAFMFYFTALAMGFKISYILLLAAYSVFEIANYLPISFGGIGLREFVFLNILGGAGYESDKIIAMLIIDYIFSIVLVVVGGIFFLFIDKAEKPSVLIK